MDAKTKLGAFKKQLDAHLKKYLDKKLDEAKKISPHAYELMDHIADLILRGGKRIRAALLYYSYLAHGGKNKNEAMKASMAMELSETYLLIHDDIMDNDDLRRGGRTIHESYKDLAEDKYHDKINSKVFGDSLGILAGDLACALSNQILADCKFKSGQISKALNELNKVYLLEMYGQTLDIMSEIENNITKDDVNLIQQLKTVPYTFDGPIKIGAILAGINGSSLDTLSRYSVPLGTAFQIQDDILGMFGTEEKLGKPVTSDLKEGKKTLLILEALSRADKSQKEIIELNLGNKKVTYNSLKQVRKVIQETGSLEESNLFAKRLVEEAINELNKMKLKKEGKDFLLNIAEYMIKREY